MQSNHLSFIYQKLKIFQIHLLAGILLITALVGITLYTYQKSNTRTKAAGPLCNENCVHEPECCVAIRANDDPYECEWPTRGWCTPRTCNPYTGQKTNCGWYWKFHNANDNEYHIGTNTPEGYGCMIGENEGTMRPICSGGGSKPTNTPRPTQSPPTNTPKPSRPTNTPKQPKPTKAPKPTRSVNPTYPSIHPAVTSNLAPTYKPDSEPTQAVFPTQLPDFAQKPFIQLPISPTSVPKFSFPIIVIKTEIYNSIEHVKESIITFFKTILP